VVPEIRSVGRGREGMASPRFFRQGRRVPHSSHFFGQKFAQKLVHCCNWLLTETQCKILFQYSGIFLTCMSVRVCRPKLFKNLCLSLVSGVPHYFFRTTPLPEIRMRTDPHSNCQTPPPIRFCPRLVTLSRSPSPLPKDAGTWAGMGHCPIPSVR